MARHNSFFNGEVAAVGGRCREGQAEGRIERRDMTFPGTAILAKKVI